MKFTTEYSVLSTSSRSSQDLETSQTLLPNQDHEVNTKSKYLDLSGTKLLLITLTQLLILTTLTTLAYFLGQHSISLEKCGQKLSTYSPALPSISYHHETFSGKFLASSIYRGTPRPELEAAWKRIANDGLQSIRIPSNELWRLNKTKEGVGLGLVGFGEEHGKGDLDGDKEGFLEVFHQLHCLNELRKKTWPEVYPPHANASLERNHIDHCIEMLRQNIMCTADVTPITSNWVPWGPNPYPDFSTLHTCRDFDRIFEWVEENAVDTGEAREEH